MRYFIVFLFLINPSWSCLFGLFFSFWLLHLGKKSPTLVNPYYLFLSTTISLMLHNHIYSEYYLSALTGETLIIIVLGLFTFIIGLNSFKLKKRHTVNDELSFWAALIFGVLPYLIGIINVGIPILSDDPDTIKRLFFIPIIGNFTVFLTLSLIIAFKKKKKGLIVLSLILNIFFSIIITTKFALGVLFILLIFCLVKYTNFKFNKKFGVIFSSLIILSVLFIFNIYGNVRNKDQVEYHWKTELEFGTSFIDRQVSLIAAPYFYIVTPWANLDYNIKNLNGNYEKGLLTIRPLMSILQLDEIIKVNSKQIKNMPWNTHGYLTDFYVDFGLMGVVFLSFFLGRTVKYIYNNSIYRQNSIDDVLWVYFAFATLMMFFSNHFTSVGYPIVTFIIMSTFRFIVKSSNTK